MNRTLLSTTLFLSLAAPAAFAQAASAPVQAPMQHRDYNPHKAAMKMGKQLGLSQDQTSKLEPILAERRSKMQALEADTTLTPEQKQAQHRQIAQDAQKEMGSVLTPEQMANLKAMRRDHKRDAPQS